MEPATSSGCALDGVGCAAASVAARGDVVAREARRLAGRHADRLQQLSSGGSGSSSGCCRSTEGTRFRSPTATTTTRIPRWSPDGRHDRVHLEPIRQHRAVADRRVSRRRSAHSRSPSAAISSRVATLRPCASLDEARHRHAGPRQHHRSARLRSYARGRGVDACGRSDRAGASGDRDAGISTVRGDSRICRAASIGWPSPSAAARRTRSLTSRSDPARCLDGRAREP